MLNQRRQLMSEPAQSLQKCLAQNSINCTRKAQHMRKQGISPMRGQSSSLCMQRAFLQGKPWRSTFKLRLSNQYPVQHKASTASAAALPPTMCCCYLKCNLHLAWHGPT